MYKIPPGGGGGSIASSRPNSGVNENQTVFLIINGVNIISYAYIYIDVLRPLTNDLWVFLFQTIDAEYVK